MRGRKDEEPLDMSRLYIGKLNESHEECGSGGRGAGASFLDENKNHFSAGCGGAGLSSQILVGQARKMMS